MRIRISINVNVKNQNGFQKVEKSQVDQKLEVAKRKLHEGYQQAESGEWFLP